METSFTAAVAGAAFAAGVVAAVVVAAVAGVVAVRCPEAARAKAWAQGQAASPAVPAASVVALRAAPP